MSHTHTPHTGVRFSQCGDSFCTKQKTAKRQRKAGKGEGERKRENTARFHVLTAINSNAAGPRRAASHAYYTGRQP